MKLSTIQLEASVIADLYKKNLVEAKKPGLPENGEKAAISKETPGKYPEQHPVPADIKKDILILVNYEGPGELPGEELVFLTNMLTACKLSIADTVIMNLNKVPNPTYKAITAKLHSKIILLFGVTPSSLELPIDFPPFQVQSLNTVTFLYSAALDEIKKDKILKSKLWVCLQKIFNL